MVETAVRLATRLSVVRQRTRSGTAMSFQPFEMERWQSTHEHDVRYNLSESASERLSEALDRCATVIDPIRHAI